MSQNTAIDFRAMAKGIRAGGIAIGMEATRLAECGESDRAEELNKAASSLGELANQLEAWRQEQEQLRRVPISAAALMERLASSLGFQEKYCLEAISELQQRGLHGPCNHLIYIAACLKEDRRRLLEAMAYGKGVEQ